MAVDAGWRWHIGVVRQCLPGERQGQWAVRNSFNAACDVTRVSHVP